MQDLTNIQEVQAAVNQYGEVVISKNKENNVVIMTMDEYKKRKMKLDIIEKLKQSEKEIENGEGIDAEAVFKELREKYEY